jgi:hypothetical protein
MSIENHPDGLIKPPYQEVENVIRTLTMLTYTSTALVSLLLSFVSVSTSETAPQALQLQPATTLPTLAVSTIQSTQRLFHRGSGRYDGGMMN